MQEGAGGGRDVRGVEFHFDVSQEDGTHGSITNKGVTITTMQLVDQFVSQCGIARDGTGSIGRVGGGIDGCSDGDVHGGGWECAILSKCQLSECVEGGGGVACLSRHIRRSDAKTSSGGGGNRG